MKILAAVSSKHGSTTEIAEAIGAELASHGHEVRVQPVQEVGSIEEFDAVVLGSAVYLGQWMKPAKEFARREASALALRPLWLFSSGPVGDPATPEEPADRRQGDALADTLGARAHVIFRGKVDRDHLGFGERAVVRLARAPSADQRDWNAIRRWANDIAADLVAPRA